MSQLRAAAEAVMEQLKYGWVCESDPVAQDLRAALAEPDEYARANPLGGPAVVFEAIAERLRAGEPYNEVLADYGLQHIEEGK